MAETKTMVEWLSVELHEGRYFEIDGWGHGSSLIACEDGFCEWRIEGRYCDWAVEAVRVTGRKLRARPGSNGAEWVRVEVELKNEDEPNGIRRGWMLAG